MKYTEEQEFEIVFHPVREENDVPHKGNVELERQKVFVRHCNHVVFESENRFKFH